MHQETKKLKILPLSEIADALRAHKDQLKKDVDEANEALVRHEASTFHRHLPSLRMKHWFVRSPHLRRHDKPVYDFLPEGWGPRLSCMNPSLQRSIPEFPGDHLWVL